MISAVTLNGRTVCKTFSRLSDAQALLTIHECRIRVRHHNTDLQVLRRTQSDLFGNVRSSSGPFGSVTAADPHEILD